MNAKQWLNTNASAQVAAAPFAARPLRVLAFCCATRGPQRCALSPLGYAVRFRLGSNAYAFLPIQKLTTHYATLIMNPWHVIPILGGSENQIYQARNCIGTSIEIPLVYWNFPMRVNF